MNLTTLLAKHLRNVYFGGNWTTSNLKIEHTHYHLGQIALIKKILFQTNENLKND